MVLHIYAVRHGQTYFNRYNRLQGWSNSPLTERGLADAERAGRKLEGVAFQAAYSSDTTRARATAERILDLNQASAPRPTLRTAMNFREQFYGYYEGQDMGLAWWAAGAPHGAPSYQGIVDEFGLGATRDFLKQADPFHDAEDDQEYWRRVEGGFRLLAQDGTLRDGDRVLLVWHGNSLLSMMHRFAGDGYDLSERPTNGSVTVFDYDTAAPFERSIEVVSYNQ
ncbi:histidine phosphatase family protein [Bifidobacterium xylocopae]|uniref:Histidine phosphatase family protein n=1 Tax=Bifidobacterium xylocopae TaxID=2493119 RepID=A0A366KEH2_9BIFI|nr:histidine phosphatase family protein [Bifidobacterium xylocopae]RBQ00117.1 histidine phosphatase family protein [Bifidobacterium xylocopae]